MQMFSKVWHKRTVSNNWQDRGVIASIVRQVAALEWRWRTPHAIEPKEARPLSLTCPLQEWLKHQVREELRQAMLATTSKRKDMIGIHAGTEYEPTEALLRSSELGAEDQAMLRIILQGKTITKDCMSDAIITKAVASGEPLTASQIRKCRQCDACMQERSIDVDETALHVSRDCPSFQKLRGPLFRASTEEARKKWLPCFWCSGIAPKDKEVEAMNRNLPDFSYEELEPPMRTREDIMVEWTRPDHDGTYRMVVAGDGACPNQGTKLARA